ncbi:hypothetical protein H2248_012186 [Termitomyces sp. 'cryptogamus']|nr:hypothetical protein H2248_012186 [Termitomyces sp. 'cryptogamus']
MSEFTDAGHPRVWSVDDDTVRREIKYEAQVKALLYHPSSCLNRSFVEGVMKGYNSLNRIGHNA